MIIIQQTKKIKTLNPPLTLNPITFRSLKISLACNRSVIFSFQTSVVCVNDNYFGTGMNLLNRGGPNARISLLGTLSFSRCPMHQQHRKINPVPRSPTLLTMCCCTCRRTFSRAFYPNYLPLSMVTNTGSSSKSQGQAPTPPP